MMIDGHLSRRVLFWCLLGPALGGDAADYFVIDPGRLVFVVRHDHKKQTCDRACATRVLGKKASEF